MFRFKLKQNKQHYYLNNYCYIVKFLGTVIAD